MRLTRKCQMTVPKRIRQKMGIGPGSNVDIVMRDGNPVLIKADADQLNADRRLEELREHLARIRGSRKSDLTSDEIIGLTRGPFDDVDNH
jgi:AbrB family looped-hinge helix DNA binding protein